MTVLLEAAQSDWTGSIITGVVVFAGLLSLLGIVVTVGAGRPHARSE